LNLFSILWPGQIIVVHNKHNKRHNENNIKQCFKITIRVFSFPFFGVASLKEHPMTDFALPH
jgi:hypothetical protein